MKMTKRIFSLALCLVLMMALALPAMAAGETYTLTIHNEKDGHTYEAYQIFSGDLLDEGGKQILSNIKWGSSVANPAALLEAIEDEAGLSVLDGATNAASLAALLGAVSSDSATIDLFAQVIGPHLSNPTGTSGAATKGEGDTLYSYTISGLVAGYYLVMDKEGTMDGENDVATKYILRVVKNVEVTAKGSVPTVDKTVNDTIDGTFGEHEDGDIGDIMYYKWAGTLASNLDAYESYHYAFKDTLSVGLAFQGIKQIYIESQDGELVHTFYDVTNESTADDTLPATVTENVTDLGEEGTLVSLTFQDLKALYENLLPSHKIIVKYSAMITRDAVTETAIPNKVKLEFSNDPQGDGTGETPEDYAFVFTFKIDVDKYDADNTAKKLENAKFVLYYERIENEVKTQHYAKVITEEMIADKEVINGKEVTAADLGVVHAWTTDKAQASILDTDDNGYLGVRGLDAGIFYLEEVEAPAGYNLMETPVMIEIIPTYTVGEDSASVTVDYKVDSIPQSTATVGVRNSAGSTLPVTGGVGTTMFYVVGTLLIAAAVIMLISKRRVEE